MTTENTGGVSVLEPIGRAINRTRQILFDPFNLEKWFVIGFCAWLAGLGSGRGGFNLPLNFRSRTPHCAPGLDPIKRELNSFLTPALPWLIPAGVMAVVIVLAIALLVVWLKSRGQFMFLNGIVHNRAAVSEPWTTYKNEGNSLFGFKFVVWLAAFTLTLTAVVPLIIIYAAFARTDFKVLLVGPMVGAGFLLLGLFLLGLLYSLVSVLTDDFVVPVMMLRRCGVISAWKECLTLLLNNVGGFILYLLIIFAAGIALGILTSMIIFTAFCCFCCVSWVFFIPFVGGYLFSVLLLPLSVWRRSYAVLFLAQFGPAYDVFTLAVPPAPPASGAINFETTDIEPSTDPDQPQNPPYL